MTAQVPEKILVEGALRSMNFCPPLPQNHPRVQPVADGERRAAPGVVYSTACWRQYIGTWEIRDDFFYLVALQGRFRLLGDEPLLADWFTGLLRLPQGEMLQYIHMGFASVYAQELHIQIEAGRVMASRVIDNRGQPIDADERAWRNLPGGENRFPGDTHDFSKPLKPDTKEPP